MGFEVNKVVKPKLIADAGVESLKQRAVASNLVTRNGFEQFTGIENDTVNVRVKGALPVREYAWKNDRSKPLVTDTFQDTVVQVKIEPTRNYSAVKLRDEEKLFDFDGAWGDIFARQTEALTDYNEKRILSHIVSAPYERQIVIDGTAKGIKDQIALNRDNIFNAIVDAKSDLRKMRAPGMDYVCLVGSGLASEIQKSQKLVTATGNGDTALSQATLGTIAGVQVVESPWLPAYEGYIFSKSGFVFYNAAPPVPNSAPFAATAAAGGFALRWVMDYETSFASDRSLFDTFVGYNYTRDLIELQDADGIFHTSEDLYFVRGVKLVMKTEDVNADAKDFKPGDGTASDLDLPGNKAGSYLALAYEGKLTEANARKTNYFPGLADVPGVMGTGETSGAGSDTVTDNTGQ